jgi:hypothetical protein
MDDETLVTRPGAPPAEPTTSDAELSRIAREAVRQPADPRMDRQLAKMGLTDDADAADTGRRSGQANAASSLSIASQRLDRLEGRVRRLEVAAVVLILAVVVLAVALVARTSS